MRIGILTFHRPVNYGAFLQAFSLQSRLQNEFPDAQVEIVDYIAPMEKRRIRINVLRDFKHGGLKGGLQSLQKVRMFRKSQKWLTLSDRTFCDKDPKALYEYIQNRYDRLIIGSDAVFNWKQTGFPTVFIPDYDFGIPVMTYAASVHGLKYYDVEADKLQTCAKAFEKMQFIGVRDACTEKFVQHCLPEAKPQFCCDPTLFIDGDKIKELAGDYTKRIEKKYKFSLEKQYIVLMAPDSKLTKSIAEKYRGQYNIVALFKNSRYADVFLHDLNPFEWAMVLRGASATVTSYFHGTLLSLVQGTPAIVLDYSGYEAQYQGKLDDLMCTRLGLPELYFNKAYAETFAGTSEDWALFDSLLAGERTGRIREAVARVSKTADAFVDNLRD